MDIFVLPYYKYRALKENYLCYQHPNTEFPPEVLLMLHVLIKVEAG